MGDLSACTDDESSAIYIPALPEGMKATQLTVVMLHMTKPAEQNKAAWKAYMSGSWLQRRQQVPPRP
jgi:hypothetical protein